MRRGLLAVLVLAGLLMVNQPIVAFGAERLRQYEVGKIEYKRRYGHWESLPVPRDFRVNAIHAALLHTGKVLIIAGSGNDRERFEAGTFRTILWDPRTGEFTDVKTPTDVFCAGHTFLASGNLLVAGGTKSYEVLDVTHAAGVMTIKNEAVHDSPHTFRKGTIFRGISGQSYALRADVTVPPATTMTHDGQKVRHAGQAEGWVDAVEEGAGPVVDRPANYTIDGVTGTDLYGVAEKITLEKQEYGGDRTSYEFDPVSETYVRVGDLTRARWYPTLAALPSGDVLAVSGLDEFGRILHGQNEVYRAAERRWVDAPNLSRYFPTYPALFGMSDERLFYSGSTSGYGSDTEGRTPGLWDLDDNTFTPVPGLRDADQTETSASVLLPPAQDQKVMILGGGGVGDLPTSTRRTDIVDLSATHPVYRPGPDLPQPVRYLSTVVLPDDTVFTSGGASGYRGGPYRGETRSDVLGAQIYDPGAEEFREAAAPSVGRNYHSEALLLPDGRVITLGSDPLYGEDGRSAGTFEQRIEIYSPPYLFKGARPEITGGPETIVRGKSARFLTPRPGEIVSARLVRPSAVTHVTDVDQRSIALPLTPESGAVSLAVPEAAGLVPSGWYLLFVTTADGVPSTGRWVEVR
ncbi:radical copper oxidase GlxA [Catenuloplanes japonicus]|uniref:galactose oxidase early set domain-containing protein n=1 Tax=Catenuloplanes japonicus TaxID=33876 RepID=UPI000A86493D|nr:galactose oxidase early set domain-containing protein [Catenuloplanes japonicus]